MFIATYKLVLFSINIAPFSFVLIIFKSLFYQFYQQNMEIDKEYDEFLALAQQLSISSSVKPPDRCHRMPLCKQIATYAEKYYETFYFSFAI